MFCSQCGNKIKDNTAFCPLCGKEIKAATKDSFKEDKLLQKQFGGIEKKRAMRVVALVAVIVTVVVCGIGISTSFGGKTLSVEVEENVDDYTWSELSTISDEISAAQTDDEAIEIAKHYNLVNTNGTLDGTQRKNVVLNDRGVSIATSVQIAGFNHDEKTDGSGKAGISFIFTDAINFDAMSFRPSNEGGWEQSHAREWLQEEGFGMLPDDLQTAIVSVNKATNNVGYTQEIASVTRTSDSLWLFSFAEVCDEDDLEQGLPDWLTSIYQAEGSQYKLFKDCAVEKESSNEILIKSYLSNGGTNSWALRTPDATYADSYYYVEFDGCPGACSFSSQGYGYVPGFCV